MALALVSIFINGVIIKSYNFEWTLLMIGLLDSRVPHYLKQTLAFLGQTITQPAISNGSFMSKYVDAEKQTIKNKLESIVNDKIRYAAERCIQIMYGDDPFRYNSLGRLDDIATLDGQRLYTQYRDWLKHAAH